MLCAVVVGLEAADKTRNPTDCKGAVQIDARGLTVVQRYYSTARLELAVGTALDGFLLTRRFPCSPRSTRSREPFDSAGSVSPPGFFVESPEGCWLISRIFLLSPGMNLQLGS